MLEDLKWLVGLVLLTFLFFFFKVFLGSLESEGGTTVVVSGTVSSSLEVLESLEVGVVTSFKLDVVHILKVDSSVRACKGVIFLSSSKSLTEHALLSYVNLTTNRLCTLFSIILIMT